MQAYQVQSATGMVKLDAMENPFTLPPDLQAQLGVRLGLVAINRYPGERIQDLKHALAEFVGMPEGFALILGNGSDELIALLSTACHLPGATALAPEPGFVMYGMSAQFQGLAYVPVALRDDFELNEEAMSEAIAQHQPAIVYLAYPNNPTANLWDAAVMRRLIAQVSSYGGWVVLDEAYQPFSSATWLAEILHDPQANAQVLLMRTLSKFGLAGVRIGYMMGRAEVIGHLNKIRPPYNVSVLNAECALFALEHQSEFERQAQIICSERERLTQALAKLPGVTPYPSQANMLLIRLAGDSVVASHIFEALRAQGVLVKNVSKMHPVLHRCLRLTVGTPKENDQLLTALKNVLATSA
ncbi:MAG: histidinol-phosphate transaminase, partial [Betaproteobacteria bacterium]|nr:histidinol-phosphate transaminase [Betaproteobacteria bacterium]